MRQGYYSAVPETSKDFMTADEWGFWYEGKAAAGDILSPTDDKLAGASGAQILWNVIIPLTKLGIMIGTIFVVTLVMGDFITVRFMSGSQSANVGRLISNDIALLQYPSASATAIVLLATVLITIGILLRFVDIRKEL